MAVDFDPANPGTDGVLTDPGTYSNLFFIKLT